MQTLSRRSDTLINQRNPPLPLGGPTASSAAPATPRTQPPLSRFRVNINSLPSSEEILQSLTKQQQTLNPPPPKQVCSVYMMVSLNKAALKEPIFAFQKIFQSISGIQPLGVSLVAKSMVEIFIFKDDLSKAQFLSPMSSGALGQGHPPQSSNTQSVLPPGAHLGHVPGLPEILAVGVSKSRRAKNPVPPAASTTTGKSPDSTGKTLGVHPIFPESDIMDPNPFRPPSYGLSDMLMITFLDFIANAKIVTIKSIHPSLTVSVSTS
eukprot:gene36572-47649_t